MNSVVEQMVKSYENEHMDEAQKLREVMQRIALAGLYRGGFFSEAAFYGGTCLRLFYGLPRMSEDMAFSLLKKNRDFEIERYFSHIMREFEALGIEVSIKKKKKSVDTAIESAFLKNTTEMIDLGIDAQSAIRIKLEVDTTPPGGFDTENKVLLQPFSFFTRCYKLPYLYAGKMHALLYRGWKTRVKGRDWFDYEWFVRNDVPLDFGHFQERVRELSSESDAIKSIEEFKSRLRGKIETVDFALAKRDVAPFIEDTSVLDIWSREFFEQLVDLMRFQ